MVNTPLGDTYVVVRFDKAGTVCSVAAWMKASVEQLPGNPKVAWVCPLNRRHQRLLGRGDVGATDTDLAQAVAAQDVEEMAVLLPQCADMLRRGQLEWQRLSRHRAGVSPETAGGDDEPCSSHLLTYSPEAQLSTKHAKCLLYCY